MTRLPAWRPASPVWPIIGCVNLAAGAVLAVTPGRSDDLWMVYAWLSAWLRHGLNPYDQPALMADWPPSAMPVLAPLHAVPVAALPWIWVCLNILLTLLVCRLIAQ